MAAKRIGKNPAEGANNARKKRPARSQARASTPMPAPAPKDRERGARTAIPAPDLPPSDLTAEMSRLVLSLVAGWSPSPLRFPRPTALKFAGTDYSDVAAAISVDGDELRIACSDTGSRLFITELFDTMNKPFSGELEDGSTFSAEIGHWTRSSMGPEGSTAVLEGNYWHVEKEPEQPRIWVGRLQHQGTFRNSPTNLSTRMVRRHQDDSWNLSGTGGHVYLVGRYSYCVVRVGDGDFAEVYLVVDTLHRGHPTRTNLYEDFLALAFVLGRALRVDVLHGVAPSGQTVAWVGGRFGRLAEGHQAPVPSGITREAWVAPLFSKISRAYVDRPLLRLYVPLTYYVEAFTEHLDGRYIKLYLGTVALARAYVLEREARLPSAAKSEDVWNVWVSAHQDELLHLATPDGGSDFLSRVRAASEADRASVVEHAFRMLGLPLAEALREELGRAEEALSIGGLSLGKGAEHDVEADLRRIASMRTTLVALLSLIVQYRGAILGPDREPHRDFNEADTDWWRVDEADAQEAKRHFLVTGSSPYVEWPLFSAQPSKQSALLRRVAAFADRLQLRTGGGVLARLQPVPKGSDPEPQRYDFKLLVAKHPASQSTLFSVRDAGAQIVVTGWERDVPAMADATATDAFLLSVAGSENVHRQIGRMMAYADELDRGAR